MKWLGVLALLPLLAAPVVFPGLRFRDEGVSKGYATAVNCTGAGVTCSVAGSQATINVAGGGGGTGTPGGLTNDLQKNDGAGGFAAYTGTSCAYAVKTLTSAGTATCTSAPTIPTDISGEQYWVGAASANLSAEKNLGALSTGLVINTAGAPSAYAGTSCAYAVKTLDASGASTCTAAPSIPTDLSAEPFITTTASANLSAEFALASLATGILLNTTATGIPTIYAGTSCAANQYMNALDTSGVKTCAQVATSQLSGTITDAQLTSNYSGVGACAAGRFASTLNDNAAPTCTQVAYADVSGTPTLRYQTVQDDGVDQTQRSKLNLISGTNVTVTCADNAGADKSDCTIAASGGAGAPGGSNTQVQYNNSSAFGGMANFTSDASGYATAPGASAPSAPSSGSKLYSDDRGGMSWPVFFTEQGAAHYVPRAPWSVDVSWMVAPHSGTGTTAPQTVGLTLAAAVGTVSNPAPSFASNVDGSMTKVVLASAAAANSAAEWKGTALNWVRGTASDGDAAGFLFVVRATMETPLPANVRAFFGMQSGTAALSVSAAPTAALNSLYFGYDAGQLSYRFCSNDGAGAATCTDCGANFPNGGSNVYEFMIFAKPNDTAVYYYAKRLDSAVTACSGSVTTDIPGTTTGLTPHLFCNNGGTASACSFGINSMYLEKGI